MNVNGEVKRILCFGDSNTWGWIPGSSGGPEGRFPSDIRWTGVLQKLLGDKYEVIEEGLPARTTAFDDPRPEFVGKNGKTYLRPCLDSQLSLGWVVLILGTCETKPLFGKTAEEIAGGMRTLLEMIRSLKLNVETESPRIILVAPPKILEEVPFAANLYAGGNKKVEQLQDLYAGLAKEFDCIYVSAFDLVTTSTVDGLHLEATEHTKLATRFAEIIKGKNV